MYLSTRTFQLFKPSLVRLDPRPGPLLQDGGTAGGASGCAASFRAGTLGDAWEFTRARFWFVGCYVDKDPDNLRLAYEGEDSMTPEVAQSGWPGRAELLAK